MDWVELDELEIKKYLKNREPMLLINSARVVPGEKGISTRKLNGNEWFFPCHFPDEPLMPGVLQLETLFETAALTIKVLNGHKNKLTNIVKVNNVSFLYPIKPGSEIKATTIINRYRRGIIEAGGEIYCNGELACRADFILAIPTDMPER